MPRISRTLSAPYQNLSLPVHSSDQITTSQMASSPFFKLFDKNCGPVQLPVIFTSLLLLPHLMHRYLSASPHHSVRCFVFSLFFSTKTHFSFGIGLSSSQSVHGSTKQWKLAAYCNAAHTSSLSCLIVSALASALIPSSSNAPVFANSAFSLTSVTKTSQTATYFSFPFWCGAPLHVPLPPKCMFLADHVIPSQFFLTTNRHLTLLA